MKSNRLLVGFVLSLVIGLASTHPVLARKLVIGTISHAPVDVIKDYTPFAKYLAGQLKSNGISEGKVIVARSISQMAEYLRIGKIDIYFDSPLVALAVQKQSNSNFMLRRWKKGSKEYRSVIFVRKDSKKMDIRDLLGSVIAFEETFSSSGHLLPRIIMEQQGIEFEMVNHPQDEPQANHVGFAFSHDDESTFEWVSRGRVAAGAMSEMSYKSNVNGADKEFRLIAKTFAIPRHVAIVPADLPEPLYNALKNVLINAHRTEAGKAALLTFEKTSKFDEIPTETVQILSKVKNHIVSIFGGNKH